VKGFVAEGTVGPSGLDHVVEGSGGLANQTGRDRARTCDLILVRDAAEHVNPLPEQALTAGDTPACTNSRTQSKEKSHEMPAAAQADTGGQGAPTPPTPSNAEGLDALAQAIANLSAKDRAALAAMLGNPAVCPDAQAERPSGSGGEKGGSQ
jgi:hypothetical protein